MITASRDLIIIVIISEIALVLEIGEISLILQCLLQFMMDGFYFGRYMLLSNKVYNTKQFTKKHLKM